MLAEVINASIVVVSDAIRPSLFQPETLKQSGLISELQQPASDPPKLVLASSETQSVVRMDSGFSVVVENGRLSVADESENAVTGAGRLQRLLRGVLDSYFSQGVRFSPVKAVGINFVVLVENEDATNFIKRRLLASGPWIEGDHPAQAAAVTLIYSGDPGRLQLVIDSGTALRRISGGSRERLIKGVILNFNFHVDIEFAPETSVEGETARVQARIQQSKDILALVFGEDVDFR